MDATLPAVAIAIRVTLPDGRYATVRHEVPVEDLATVNRAATWRVRFDGRLTQVFADVRECVTPGGWGYADPGATIAGEPLEERAP